MQKVDFKDRVVLRIPYAGGEPKPGVLVELLYRPELAETLYAVWNGAALKYEPLFPLADNQVYVPFSAQNNLLKNGVVLAASDAVSYDSESALVDEVRAFIHRYVTVSPLFELVATYYILLTWIYDSFNTLPYLRVRGDFGSGKTRFLTVVGSLCFRGIFASGASTVSPVFRMLHAFRGTLIIDEGDFRVSDEKAELTKILNNGNARGFPVLRSEQSGRSKEFNPVAYDVYGPKVVATRGYYQDAALESRFISEDMGRNRPRDDIPLHLPDSFSAEARQLRNKLLMFRFIHFKKFSIVSTTANVPEPRINQIFAPLLALISNETERNNILEILSEYSRELSLDRSSNIESYVLDVINELWRGEALSIKDITKRLNEKHADDFQERFSGKRIGFVVRRSLNIRTRKRSGIFEIPASEAERLQILFKKFAMAEGL